MDHCAPIPTSLALTVIAGAQSTNQPIRRVTRPESGFLAQIIASQSDVMQYRARRRETPDYAIQAYASASCNKAAKLSVAA
jgi:hypothetical protein